MACIGNKRISDRLHLRFQGISRPVELEAAADLLPAIKTVFRAWPWHHLSRLSPLEPIIVLRREGPGYIRYSPWTSKREVDDNPADAMCDFVSDVIDAYLENRANILGLHAAAVRMADGLVVFPSSHRSGKSLLAMNLVRRGGELYSDDVLLLPASTGQGMATGIAPRLRLPLPPGVSAGLAGYLERDGWCANQRYGWPRLAPPEIAALGTRAPVRAIVTLHREQHEGAPNMAPMTSSEGLKTLVKQGFALNAPVGVVLSRLSALVTGAPCYRLTYADPSAAADLLCRTFGLPDQVLRS